MVRRLELSQVTSAWPPAGRGPEIQLYHTSRDSKSLDPRVRGAPCVVNTLCSLPLHQCQKNNVPLSTQHLHVWNSQVQVCPLHRFLWWALTFILLLLTTTTTTVILRMAHSWVLCTVLMNYQSWGSPWGPPDLWPDRSESGLRDPKFAARVRSEGSPVWTVPATLQSSKLHSYCQSHWLFLSSSVMSESLQPPGLQHTRFPFNLLNL